jgi:4-amino-4-deoxy-L-arabinose transferase-like glycosyltransferase
MLASRYATWLTGAVALAVALRAPFVFDTPEPDEGGYLLVARNWHVGDASLYGRYWVDRPPLLLLLYKAADSWGRYGVRMLGCLAVVVLVLAAAAAARAVAGRRASVTAAWVAAALGSSYALAAYEVDGELLAAALVMTSCALTLWAVYRAHGAGGRLVASVLAGIAGVAAIATKQNFADGLVFAAALLAACRVAGSPERRRLGAVLAGGLAGVGIALGALAVWVLTSGVGIADLAYATYGFRLDGDRVIGEGPIGAPAERVGVLLLMAVVSGLVALIVLFVVTSRGRLRDGDPVSRAVAVMVAFGVVGVVAGGSYWPHYLIQLVPAAALGAGLVADRPSAATWARRCAALAVSASLVASCVGAVLGAAPGAPEASVQTMGHWLHRSAHRGDTVVVTYGHANVVLESGLVSPYPYLWSLPTRVRDPRLELLTRTLSGPRAPTWVVEWNDFDSFGLDRHRRLASVVRRRYHRVVSLCGHDVYLLDSRRREPAAASGPCGEV